MEFVWRREIIWEHGRQWQRSEDIAVTNKSETVEACVQPVNEVKNGSMMECTGCDGGGRRLKQLSDTVFSGSH